MSYCWQHSAVKPYSDQSEIDAVGSGNFLKMTMDS